MEKTCVSLLIFATNLFLLIFFSKIIIKTHTQILNGEKEEDREELEVQSNINFFIEKIAKKVTIIN